MTPTGAISILNESISREHTVNSAPLTENEKGAEKGIESDTTEVGTSEAQFKDAEESFRKGSSETEAGEGLNPVARSTSRTSGPSPSESRIQPGARG